MNGSKRIKATATKICENFYRIDECCGLTAKEFCPDCTRWWNILRWQCKTYAHVTNLLSIPVLSMPDPIFTITLYGFSYRILPKLCAGTEISFPAEVIQELLKK